MWTWVWLWSAFAEAAPPEGWKDLALVPGLVLDIRYASAQNFTGAPLPGYELPCAWLREPVAEALGRVARRLQPEGYTLVIYDAWRPVQASQAMVTWAESSGQTVLLEQGYVARRSRHNLGVAVDLGLLKDGLPVDMGTPYDTFSTASHVMQAAGPHLERRLLLQAAMKAEGFDPYSKEWWHFSMKLPGASPLDGSCS
jgi:D-alanyl-D-alanine dipeptidase